MLRIVNWNMAARETNWARVSELMGGGPAIALLQEAVVPSDPSMFDEVRGGGPTGDEWSTVKAGRIARTTAVAVRGVDVTWPERVSLDAATGEQLTISHPGSYAACVASIDGTEVGLVSFYALWERQGDTIYSEATLHRTLSDLTAWLQRPPPGGLVIAGDFNAYYKVAGWWHDRYMTAFDRLAAYGMTMLGPIGVGPLDGCPCKLGEDCRHVRTFAFHSKEGNGKHQLDFVFGSKAIVSARPSCAVAEGAAFDYSDHLPVVTDLVLPEPAC